MKRTFTAKEKAFVFDLWKRGTGFSDIAKILDSKPGTIFTILRDTAVIKPTERHRPVAYLTLSKREEIRASLSAKRRNYKAVDANNRGNRMAKRPKACLLEQNSRLRELMLEKLELKWSPEQISGQLKRTMPRQKTMQISAETIYKTLYFRSRSALHHLLVKHLRHSHRLRHGKHYPRMGERHHQYSERHFNP